MGNPHLYQTVSLEEILVMGEWLCGERIRDRHASADAGAFGLIDGIDEGSGRAT